jgi:hypothetical protein
MGDPNLNGRHQIPLIYLLEMGNTTEGESEWATKKQKNRSRRNEVKKKNQKKVEERKRKLNRTSSINWAQPSRFNLRPETESILTKVLFKIRYTTVYNIHNVNSFINIPQSQSGTP